MTARSIIAQCGCPADAGEATVVIHHNSACNLIPWPRADESLANFWTGWPIAAREYREMKQQQVQRLQTTVDALHGAVRERDTTLLEVQRALTGFLVWWNSDELDGDVVEDLRRVLYRVQGVLRT